MWTKRTSCYWLMTLQWASDWSFLIFWKWLLQNLKINLNTAGLTGCRLSATSTHSDEMDWMYQLCVTILIVQSECNWICSYLVRKSWFQLLNLNTAGLGADFMPVAHVGWSGLNVPTAHYTGLSRQTQLGILFINSWSALFFQTIWQRFKIFHSEKVCRVTYVSYVWHKECL